MGRQKSAEAIVPVESGPPIGAVRSHPKRPKRSREGLNTQTQGTTKSLRDGMRPKTRQSSHRQLALTWEEAGEAQPAPTQGHEPSPATDRPAALTQTAHLATGLMEAVVSAANMRQALKRVRANKGSPGVDGMTVRELPEYLTTHWPRI